MKNHLQKGKVFEIVAGATIAPGDFVLQGAMFGVAINGGVTGTVIEVLTGEVFSLPKASGAWTLGVVLYWDNSAKNVTTTSTSNTKIGTAFAAQASGDTLGAVRLNRSF